MNEDFQRREFFDIKDTYVVDQKKKLYIKTKKVMKFKRFSKILLETAGLMLVAAIVGWGIGALLVRYPIQTLLGLFLAVVVAVSTAKYISTKE